jgi:Tfp pilus assembly protein PilF
VTRVLLAGLLALSASRPAAAQGQEQVIDLRAARAPAGNSFEALWAAYRQADTSGEKETRDKVFHEIRRLRIERNIRSLETLALALVAQGLQKLESGRRDEAEEDFRRAIGLDPHLPDAYLGLAATDLKRGVLGGVSAVRHTVQGVTARLPTSRGQFYLIALLLPVVLVAALVTVAAFALTLVIRHGPLLLHDLEESLGTGRGRPYALGVYVALLLLPAITFQGYGWLPLWWLTLLFIYVGKAEQIVTGVVLVGALAVGPLVGALESRVRAFQNPLFRASVQAIDGGPDVRATMALEGALREKLDDRDLVYLLAILYKKAGAYDEAGLLYRDVLQADRRNSLALNNLANVEFARGEFQAALARYKAGTELPDIAPEVQGTFFYNQSLAHLQRFEYQPATEARTQAERLAEGLVDRYDRLWKYDKGDYAVVDLSLDQQQLWEKFGDASEGTAVENIWDNGGGPAPTGLLSQLFNRFAGFLAVAGVTLWLLRRWRGPRMFTQRCLKCGTPFCKRCHLGAAAGALCTQCYHLFVVRDGVSGPARNQKLLEVQKEDERRERVFRALSLISPGAGHVYAQRTASGVLFMASWYLLLTLALLAGRLVPFTEASEAVSQPWPLALAGLALLALYVAANRARPDFEEIALPVRRSTRGRRNRT